MDSSSQKLKRSNNKKSYESILISSTRKPNLIETDDGGEFVHKRNTDFLNKTNIKSYSGKTSLGDAFCRKI